MQPLPIQSILAKVLKNLDLKRKQEQGKIHEFWEEGVGSKIAKHTSPHSLTSQGRLLVNVDSSPWVEELTRYKKGDKQSSGTRSGKRNFLSHR